MRIAIVSDAWRPQINGVVLTLEHTIAHLREAGHEVMVYGPDLFRSVPCPGYREIRLALLPYRRLAGLLARFRPDALHIATEGPLGLAARRYARKRGLDFTTAYHTKFPEYLQARTGVPARCFYPLMRWFHRPSKAVMVSTEGVIDELRARGFGNLVKWSRGVDMACFHPPVATERRRDGRRPVFLYVGRIAVEKNLEAFLALPLPGEKWLVGAGPALSGLQAAYPDALFFGAKSHAELAPIYRQADVFVFPSKTDTFGLVLLEALSSGLPVAAYPVAGPLDVLQGCAAAALRHDLFDACLAALEMDPALAVAHARRFSWQATTEQFIGNLHPTPGSGDVRLDAQSATAGVLSR